MTMSTEKSSKRVEKNGVKAPESDQSGLATPAPQPKALWDGVRRADEAVKAAEKAVLDAKALESAAIKAVVTAFGNGPFQVAGIGLVQIRHRPRKNEQGEKEDGVFFLVSMGDKQVTIVE